MNRRDGMPAFAALPVQQLRTDDCQPELERSLNFREQIRRKNPYCQLVKRLTVPPPIHITLTGTQASASQYTRKNTIVIYGNVPGTAPPITISDAFSNLVITWRTRFVFSHCMVLRHTWIVILCF